MNLELATVSDPYIANIMANVVIDPAYTHAPERHKDTYQRVRDCLEKKGPYIQFQIEPKKQYLRVCIVDEKKGLIGFQIVDIVDKVAKENTAYIKDGIRSIKQLLDYARRMGYPRFKGIL